MEKVFIIILNWNGKENTLECLKSIKKLSIINYQLSIVVVDNGSTDGSTETIEKSYPEVKVLKNEKNLGFAAGNNVGVKYALENGADRIIILNNDTIVPKNFLDLLKNEADIVGPVIKFKSKGRWIYDYGGVVNFWIGRPKHHELPHHLVVWGPVGLHPHPTSSVEVSTCGRSMGVPRARHPSLSLVPDYLSGCCLLVKRKVFEKIGLFDERFFLYFEDADFCLRAKKAGFEVALEPGVVIYHKLGGTIGRWSETAIYHNLRSNFLFISKHLGWKQPFGYFYLMLLSIKIVIDKLLYKIHLGGVHSATSEVLRRQK